MKNVIMMMIMTIKIIIMIMGRQALGVPDFSTTQ
jgi:hypothetical protein